MLMCGAVDAMAAFLSTIVNPNRYMLVSARGKEQAIKRQTSRTRDG